jgi:hypothetical protein
VAESYAVGIILCPTLWAICHIEVSSNPSKTAIKQADLLGLAVTAESGWMPLIGAENTVKMGGTQNSVRLWEELSGGIISSQQVVKLLEVSAEFASQGRPKINCFGGEIRVFVVAIECPVQNRHNTPQPSRFSRLTGLAMLV